MLVLPPLTKNLLRVLEFQVAPAEMCVINEDLVRGYVMVSNLWHSDFCRGEVILLTLLEQKDGHKWMLFAIHKL